MDLDMIHYSYKTFAELTIEEKNDISHRGIALKKISAVIKEFL